jgi:putative membrane protein
MIIKYKKLRAAQLFLFAVGIYLVSLFVPGLYIANPIAALFFSLLILVLTFLLWPLLLRFTKRFIFLTFGLGSFLLSAFILWLASVLLPSVTITGWGWIIAPLAVALVFVIVTGILNVDDDEVYARSIHNRLKRKIEKSNPVDKPGFVFLEIDGLSERVLREAIKKGAMPTLSGLLEDGSYKIKAWETDLSSQTGASQAGILHGCNKDIPAFRWVDKSNDNKIVSSNGIGDAQAIEKLISDGNGLLSVNGGAITNLFTGDSKDNIFVYSVLKNIKQLYSESWSAFYSRPFNVAQVIVLSCLDILVEIRSRYRQSRRNVQPRLKHRGLKYFVARAGANVIFREISTYTVIGDIISGEKDAIYTTYFGYDEVAHHCGVADDESFYVLNKIDRRINRIFASKKYSKRPYYISILSDHGQTNGATFKQRYGLSLHEVVKKLLPKDEGIYQELDSNQDHFGQMINAPSESLNHKFRRGSLEKRKKGARAIVLASGNLGLIYFTRWTQRLTLEDIDKTYPNMIPGLLREDGIGFLMVRSGKRGSMILSAKGTYYLADDKVEGENPLAKFGEHAAMHLRRTDSFNHVPDILVMSLFDTDKNEVAAFEELVGSHGGLGGDQSKPFIMHPSEWNLDNVEITGAENVYKVFKTKLNDAWAIKK